MKMSVRSSVKVGDLIKWKGLHEAGVGIIVDFDGDGDPIIRENDTGIIAANLKDCVEVISESR
mgnify:CR=1 FL=1